MGKDAKTEHSDLFPQSTACIDLCEVRFTDIRIMLASNDRGPSYTQQEELDHFLGI